MNELNRQMRENAMQVLIDYCKSTKCKECMFYYSEEECGIHNPSAWRGVRDE